MHEEGGSEGVRERVRERVSVEAERAKEGAARPVEQVSEVLRDSAARMEEEGLTLAPLLTSAAEQLSRFASKLRNRSSSDMLADVEAFAKRNPVLFLGASVALGFGLTRILRASRSEGTKLDAPPRVIERGEW